MKALLSLLLTFVVVTTTLGQQPPPPRHKAPPGFGVRRAPKIGASEEARPNRKRASDRPRRAAAAKETKEAKEEKPAVEPPAAEAKPQAEQAKPAEAAPAAQAASLAPAPSGGFMLNLHNANLTEVIEILARRLKISYILDPRVKGSVTMNTYGELKGIDVRALLDIILRANGAALVQAGDIYRIVPLTEISRQPLAPQVDPKDIPEDERMVLNLVFLKYASVAELSKLLERFLGEGATMVTYDPANLLLLLDNNRNIRRTMELIALFDSDALAKQRVRLFEVRHGRPSDVALELESILKGVSLTEKTASVRFLPIDRINTLVAVAPNPGVFKEVEEWLAKIDIPVKVTAGSVDNYVYRVKYGRAESLAHAIMALYLGITYGYGGFGYGGFGGYGRSGRFRGLGGYGGLGGYWAFGGYGGFGSEFDFGERGFDFPGGFGGGGYSPWGYSGAYGPRMSMVAPPAPAQEGEREGAGGAETRRRGILQPGDQTGSYLGYGYGGGFYGRIPHVVPNPLDNSLLIQATTQEYEQILKLLKDLDVPPRQVLIEAKIYEVSLTGAFASGVSAYLQKLGSGASGAPKSRIFQGTSTGVGLGLTAGMLVGQSRELLAVLTAAEDTRKAKVISAPAVIATDSIPASINVGQEVPVLTSQAVTGVQSGGSSLFANTIQSRPTGVTMSIMARVNPSGIVTLYISQEVSTPLPPSAGAAIPSPSFSTRNLQTQVTVQDGDTIAIGGIIQETDTFSSSGIPVLHRIPLLGAAFGAKSVSKERTEMVIFMTPRVVYDTNDVVEASEELKSKLRRLNKLIKE